MDCENGVVGASEEDLESRKGIAEEDRGATSDTATARGSTLDQKYGTVAMDWWCSTLVAATLRVQEYFLVGELCLAATLGSTGRS